MYRGKVMWKFACDSWNFETLIFLETFSLFTQLCPTLCNPMTAAHQASLSITNSRSLLKLMSTESVMLSNHLILCPSLSPFPFNLSQHQGLFQCQFFASSGQSIGVSASASVFPMNSQDWFPLEWTGWTSLLSKGLSRVFSNTTVQKRQFFGAQLSLESNSHIHIWLLEKAWLWLDGSLLAK